MASAFPLEQFAYFLANKNDTFTGFLVLWVLKWLFTIGKFTKLESHFRTYKNNENTTDVCVKVAKIVTVNVLESNYDHKSFL